MKNYSMKNIHHKVLILLIVTIVLGSCVSFKSVETTAKIAQKLENEKSVFDSSPCYLNSVFGSTDEDYCEYFEEKDTINLNALELLVSYGKALEKLVEDSEFEGEDQAELVLESINDAKWTELSEDQINGGKGIVDATLNLINNGVKRKVLSEEISNNDENIQSLVAALLDGLKSRRQVYKNVLTLSENLINPNPDLDVDKREVFSENKELLGYADQNKLDALTKVLLKREIEKETSRISDLEKTLTAFGKAHGILASNVEKVGKKSDAEVVNEIFDELKTLFEGFKKLDDSSVGSND